MRFQTIIISVILILLALTACRDKGTEPYVKSIWLSAEDIGVTDASIHVILSNDNKPGSFSLKLNGKTILSANKNDTLIFIDSLLPKHTYTYKAYRLNGSIVFDSSDALTITTMDTTSHNFTWEIDTLGDGGSSVLYDVAIINDTLAYAVGEIYKRDSLGNWDPLPYNLVKWNGQRWELKRVTVIFRGNPVTVPLEGIFAYSPSDIWVTGSIPIHGDGVRWIGYDIPTLVGTGATVSRMWGTPSRMYFVGRAGNIIHYDGVQWRRLESGTSAGLLDVWGHTDPFSGHTTIFSVASSAEETKILSLSAVAARDTLAWPPSERLSGIYMSNAFTVYVSSAGVWRHKNAGWKQMLELPHNIFFTGLRGTTENNIFGVAWSGILAHYNGMNWYQYTEIPEYFNFWKVAVSQNMVVAVGFMGGLPVDKAGILIGRRKQ
jgi:hypothetical protein